MTMLDYALGYARQGFRVFPLIAGTKKPLTEHGVKDATTSEYQINRWWEYHPDANIGIAMGGGIIAIDCDLDDERGIDGAGEIRRWQVDHGMLPDTVTNLTGRGGYQIFYRIPKGMKIGNRVGLLDGVDVRGDGGYVCAPPSIHPNGRRYEWEISPDDMSIAEADEIVMELLSTRRSCEARFHAPEAIPEGKRNDTLFREAYLMQSSGFCDKAIRSAIEIENAEKCVPALSDKEVRILTDSALRYNKGGALTWQKKQLLEAVRDSISK